MMVSVLVSIPTRKMFATTSKMLLDARRGEQDVRNRAAFDKSNVMVIERRPIRSGRQVLRFASDRKPTHAGVDPYNFYIDRNSADNVMPVS